MACGIWKSFPDNRKHTSCYAKECPEKKLIIRTLDIRCGEATDGEAEEKILSISLLQEAGSVLSTGLFFRSTWGGVDINSRSSLETEIQTFHIVSQNWNCNLE